MCVCWVALFKASIRLFISRCRGLKCLPPRVMWAIFDGSFGLVSWGLKCLPLYVDVGSFDWGLKCLPLYVDVGSFDRGLKCLPLYVDVGSFDGV